jgi:hypothetical protein
LPARVALHLTPALREALEAAALARGLSISALTRHVLADALLGSVAGQAPGAP